MNFPNIKLASFPLRPLALVLAAIYAPASMAAAGRIEFSTGDAVVQTRDGRERPARKGEELVAGDRILTRNGRAQLAFPDGGFISLQPNTDFGVEEYVFNGKNDGAEKSVFSLLKGALRTVTGLIGRSKRDAYTMRTPTATIGIRGTGGQIEVNDDGTFIQGSSGTWFLANKSGSLDVPAGTGGFAGKDDSKPPTSTSTTPNTPPTGAGSKFELPPTYSAGDQVGAVNAGMLSGPGYAVVSADAAGNLALNSSVNATFSATTLTAFSNWAIGTAQAVEVGNDGLIGWGRWTNGTALVNGSNASLTSSQGAHYVVGVPTAQMPGSGSATYSLLGATTPTWVSGAGSGSLTSGSLNVTFSGPASTLNYSLVISAGVGVYTMSAGSVIGAGTGSFADGVSSVSGTGSACTGACTGSVKGFFAGSAADRAGLTYQINDSMIGTSFVGAAAFKR